MAIGLLVWAVLASLAAIYCRNEWILVSRALRDQYDLTYAADISAEYWFQKYRVRESSRPGVSERDVVKEMAARHRELRRKVKEIQPK